MPGWTEPSVWCDRGEGVSQQAGDAHAVAGVGHRVGAPYPTDPGRPNHLQGIARKQRVGHGHIDRPGACGQQRARGLRQGQVEREVLVRGVSAIRGPAPVAQLLYEETPESLQAREAAAQQRRLAAEPAMSIEQGRPTKRDRRQMDKAWNERWSAGLD